MTIPGEDGGVVPLGGGLTLPPVGGAGPVVVVAPPVGEVPP